MVLKPELEAQAEDIFRKWGLDFAVIGKTTDTMRFVVRHRGEVKADLPIKELGDEAPLYDRPWTPTAPSPVLDGASIVPPMPTDAALLKLLGSPDLCSKRWVYEQYDSLDPRQHRPGPRRRRGGDPARRRAEGPRADDRLHRALLRGRPARRRQAGGGGSLAQPRRGRRAAAGADRQSQFRQSGEAARHGPARRLHRGDRRGRPRARFPDRVGQRVALQRDDGGGHSADAGDRRRRPRRRRGEDDDARLQGGGARYPPRRRGARAGSAARPGSRRSRAARRARRRRSTSPPSGATANSSPP